MTTALEAFDEWVYDVQGKPRTNEWYWQGWKIASNLAAEYRATRDAIAALHHSEDVEIEVFVEDHNGDEDLIHTEHFPDCTDYQTCEGHLVTIQTCAACGQVDGGEGVVYFRRWPCKTTRILDDPYTR